jgi:hypothetical protein
MMHGASCQTGATHSGRYDAEKNKILIYKIITAIYNALDNWSLHRIQSSKRHTNIATQWCQSALQSRFAAMLPLNNWQALRVPQPPATTALVAVVIITVVVASNASFLGFNPESSLCGYDNIRAI